MAFKHSVPKPLVTSSWSSSVERPLTDNDSFATDTYGRRDGYRTDMKNVFGALGSRSSAFAQADDTLAPAFEEQPLDGALDDRIMATNDAPTPPTPRPLTDVARDLNRLDPSTQCRDDDDPSRFVPGRDRAVSIVPSDVYGISRSRYSAGGTASLRMFGGENTSVGMGATRQSHPGAPNFESFGEPSPEKEQSSRCIRGTSKAIYLDPSDNLIALENRFSGPSALQPPLDVLVRNDMLGKKLVKTLPHSSEMPPPRVVRPNASTVVSRSVAPPPQFDDVDDPFAEVPMAPPPPEPPAPVPSASDISLDKKKNEPKFVPIPIQPKSFDEHDVQWRPPTNVDEAENEALREKLFSFTTASVVEVNPPPPSALRNIAELYRTRQRLVAYDETDAFGFTARPIGGTENIDLLRSELRLQQSCGALGEDASVQTVRHKNSVYIFAADRKSVLVFCPVGAVDATPSCAWNRVEIQDASMFRDVSAFPPSEALIVPVPNVPYFVAATADTLHIFSIEDHTWFVCVLEGFAVTSDGLVNVFKKVGFIHLIDETTLYVRDKSKKYHGSIDIREALIEVTIFRRFPHEYNTDEDSFLVEHRLKRVPCVRFRRTPCAENIIPIDSVPGVALLPVPDKHHSWIFTYNGTAKTFVPWERIETGMLFFVPMVNHLHLDCTTVLFFAEELHRVDLGTVVKKTTTAGGQKGTGANRGGTLNTPGVSTQRILRVAFRLLVRNPSVSEELPLSEALHSPLKQQQRLRTEPIVGHSNLTFQSMRGPSHDSEDVPRLRQSEMIDHGTVKKGRKILPLRPLGGNDIQARMSITSQEHSEIDVIIKARRSEIHCLIPMHDRCVAFVSFDCKVFVVVELDRRAWMKQIMAFGGNDENDEIDIDSRF